MIFFIMLNELIYLTPIFITLYYINKLINYNINDIINNNYIYNLSWEDPRTDIKIYGPFKDKNICMITTGGDNVLDYLIEDPKSIHTFDFNEHQNFLLEMKIACIKSLTHDECFEIIGNNNYKLLLEKWDLIKVNLSPKSLEWWSKNKTIMKNSIYSGTVKYLYYLGNILFHIFGIKHLFTEIKNNPGIENQKDLFHKYEKKIIFMNKTFKCIETLIIPFIGVPEKQYSLYKNDNFITDLFKYWLYNFDLINDNYFYYGYLYGKFTKECCPRYLKKEYFDSVKNNLHKVNIHTKILSNINDSEVPDDLFDINILLDHLDWLDQTDIKYEFMQLQKYSKLDCKYCWRSFSEKQYFDFLKDTDFIHSSIISRDTPDIYSDRVGTYNSIHVTSLKKKKF